MPEKMCTVLDPTVQIKAGNLPLAPRPKDWNNKTVGLFWNNKPNGEILLDRIEVLLKEEFNLAGLIKKDKPLAMTPASDMLLKELAKQCHLVISAIGD